MDTRYADAGNQ